MCFLFDFVMYGIVWFCFGVLSIACGMGTCQWLSPMVGVQCVVFQSSSELSRDGY